MYNAYMKSILMNNPATRNGVLPDVSFRNSLVTPKGGCVCRLILNPFLKIKEFKNKFFPFFLLINLIITQSVFAEGNTGEISGNIMDANNGEPLIGANVYLESTALGAASDLNGNFIILNVPAGEYTLIITNVGYADTKIISVLVKSGEVLHLEIVSKPEVLTTETIVVEARALKNNEASLLKERQKSSSISDAISAEMISRTGSGDAAEAIQKVTGASIVDNKYVFIRGMGERYSITQLNGAELPSSDPEKKTFQLDLIPANMLDNIVTIKSFTPDKPGNFSGGAVDIGTKSFPDEFMLKLKIGSTINSVTTYNSNYLTHQGGSDDWMGFDDGTRAIPKALENPNIKIPIQQEARFDPQLAAELDLYSNSFNSIMDVQTEAAPIDKNLSFSIGDRIFTGETSSLGYIGSLTYGRSSSFYENGEVGRYRRNLESDVLNPQLLLKDNHGKSEANFGALADVTYYFDSEHQVGMNVFYSRSGISTSRYMSGKWPQELGIDDQYRIYVNRVMTWMERDIRSYQASGKHLIRSFFDLQMDWSATFARTTQDEPDRRLITSIETKSPTDTSYTIRGSNFDDPSRYYRKLKDHTNTLNLNFELPFTNWTVHKSKFKFGVLKQESDRVFTERIFSWLSDNTVFNQVEGNPGLLFQPENNGIVQVDTVGGGALIRHTFGNTVYDFSKSKNNYTGGQKIQAYYAMLDLPVTNRLRFIGGVRYESTLTEVISGDERQGKGYMNEKDWLPSLNFVYQLKQNMNIRVAATKTLARPNFRELAPYSTKEFVNDVEMLGNPQLKRTLITNVDLRYEWYLNPGEILAVSGFYKNLKNPIELAFQSGTTQSNPIVQFQNVPEATLVGAEFELRMSMGNLFSILNNFSVGSNLSLVQSSVDIAGSELEIRQNIDSTTSPTRTLQGQSDYILNVDLSYMNSDWGSTVSLYYNFFGERLSKVSANITPDVFEQPAAQLNLIVAQRLGSFFQLRMIVSNLLNSAHKEVYRFKGVDYNYLMYKKGISYSIGLSYQI